MEPTIIIIGILGTIISGVVITLFRRYLKNKDKSLEEARECARKQRKELDTIRDTIEDNKKELWKLRKTTLIIAKILDDQIDKMHPELTSSLEDIANELLKQSDKS